MRETCGHERATFPLNGNLYCATCAPYAWQAEVHRGHSDEPPAVSTVACHNPVCPYPHPHAPYSRGLDDERNA